MPDRVRRPPARRDAPCPARPARPPPTRRRRAPPLVARRDEFILEAREAYEAALEAELDEQPATAPYEFGGGVLEGDYE